MAGKHTSRCSRLVLAGMAAAFCIVRADAQESFDRPVVITVAGTAGGGIDLYARLLARHFARHLPGHPPVTVQVMPGAGGIRAASYLARTAPRDGTALATFAGGPLLEPLIGARDPGYDMSRFTWIGAMNKDVGLCLSWGPSPFKTIDDVRKRPMVVTGTGAGSETDTWPGILNDLLGTRIKLVTGYPGSQESLLAIERGEADGRCTISLSALKTVRPDWLRQHKVNLLLQVGLDKAGELPDVPLLLDLLTRVEDRQMIAFLVTPNAIARHFAAPPGVPPGRTTQLRRAFDATMQDAEFLADARRMQADLAPTRGEDVEALVASTYATPRPVIARVKKFLTP